MEGIDNTWDDLLHESLHFRGDVLGAPESIDSLHAYDIDFASSLSFTGKNRRVYPDALLTSIGNYFQFHSPTSTSSSSPAISDYLLFAPDDMRKFSLSTISSEGTISPKDSILSSPLLPETVGCFTKPALPTSHSPQSDDATPVPMSPISPKLVTPAIPPRAAPKPDKEVVDAAPAPSPTRRRAAAKSSAASKESTKSTTASNHNNSKPMTARDRKRRQMHNASAMRSRIRLNETLDKMWKAIPAARRRKRLAEGQDGQDPMADIDDDEEERIGRADKVEVGIEYIAYLEQRVKELEERIKRGQ